MMISGSEFEKLLFLTVSPPITITQRIKDQETSCFAPNFVPDVNYLDL